MAAYEEAREEARLLYATRSSNLTWEPPKMSSAEPYVRSTLPFESRSTRARSSAPGEGEREREKSRRSERVFRKSKMVGCGNDQRKQQRTLGSPSICTRNGTPFAELCTSIQAVLVSAV